MKLAVKFAAVSAGLFALSYLGLQHVYAMGAESTLAQLATVPPTPEDGGFLSFIMQGQYIAAVGGFLTLLVAALRNQNYGLAKWFPWFASKTGGYVLGFGSAFTLYVAAAMQSGGTSALSFSVFVAALAAGFAAGGAWEGLLDLITFLKSKPSAPDSTASSPPSDLPPPSGTTVLRDSMINDRRGFFGALGIGALSALAGKLTKTSNPEIVRQVTVHRVEVRSPDPDQWVFGLEAKAKRRIGLIGTVVLVMALVTMACTSNGCGPKTNIVKNSVIDCIAANQDVIVSLAATMWGTVTSSGSWDQVEQMAKGAGATIGGCSLVEVVQRYLGGTRALTPEQSWPARQALERFRATVAQGATFKTYAGDL